MTMAETIARALGGRKVGVGWMARCPAHADREPSLSIRDTDDGKVLVCCHAGCEQDEVIDALQSCGLWGRLGRLRQSGRCDPAAVAAPRPDRDATKRSGAAIAIWRAAAPASGSLVETYLASRGLHLPPPSVLRFHPGLKHPSGRVCPAMVALVTRATDDEPLAIHRTFLARSGAGKAPVAPAKMMLGPCRGGVVHLAAPAGVLMIGEGIETCLAVMQVTGHPTWAALSTSGLRALALPSNVRDIIVLADGDDAGEAAARACARRWRLEGRRVRIARPPRGRDFNDMMAAGAQRIKGDAR